MSRSSLFGPPAAQQFTGARGSVVSVGAAAATCLCEARRPDWPSADFLVFEPPKQEAPSIMKPTTVKVGWAAPGAPADAERPAPPSSQPPVLESNLDMSMEKQGRYFSKLKGIMGTWRIRGNVLTLIWGNPPQMDTALAVTSTGLWINEKSQLRIKTLVPHPPSWFLPDMLNDKYSAQSLACSHFECSVCFFEFYHQPVAVMRKNSKRSCAHYVHNSCGNFLVQKVKNADTEPTCPICGETFSELKLMPDLAVDPKGWFSICDCDFGGTLDQTEVVEALGTVVPCTRANLERALRMRWRDWDPDGDGNISMTEFTRPQHGLHAWLVTNLKQLGTMLRQKPKCPPVLDSNPRDWFDYWDVDMSGSLDRDEVLRALVRTLCVTRDGKPLITQAQEMRCVYESLWTALGYSAIDKVDFEEFVRPYGLMDQCLHNQAHCIYFGDDEEMVLPDAIKLDWESLQKKV